MKVSLVRPIFLALSAAIALIACERKSSSQNPNPTRVEKPYRPPVGNVPPPSPRPVPPPFGRPVPPPSNPWPIESYSSEAPASLAGLWASQLLKGNHCGLFYRIAAKESMTIEILCRLPGLKEIGVETHQFKAKYRSNSIVLEEVASSCSPRQNASSSTLYFYVSSLVGKSPSLYLNPPSKPSIALRKIPEEAKFAIVGDMQSYAGRTLRSGCFTDGSIGSFQAQNLH